MFNDDYDYIEKDENGNVVAVWCGYYADAIDKLELEEVKEQRTVVVSHSGSTPKIKVGGSAKTITSKILDNDGNELLDEISDASWEFLIDDEDASALIDLETISDKQIRIKFTGGYDYYGKVLVINYTTAEVTGSLQLEIAGL